MTTRLAYIPRKHGRPGMLQLESTQPVRRSQLTGSGSSSSSLDKIRKALGVAKRVGEKVDNLAFGKIGTAISNAVPDSDPNARPLYVGEKHAILKLANGKYGRGNFIGPGTQITKRLERGDVGRTPTDMVAMRHDIDYSLSKDVGGIRAADKRMLNSLARIKRNGLDDNFNILQGEKLIGAKVKLEDAGLLDKNKFAGDLKKAIPDSEKKLLMDAQAKLTMDGYGKKKVSKKLPPGLKLRRTLLAQTQKSSKPKRAIGVKKEDDMAKSVRAIMAQL